MAEQEALTGAAPGTGGLWARYVTGGEINHAAWLRACAEGAFVGECRRCSAHLIPERPYEVTAKRTDYTAACRLDCGFVMTAPGGRVYRGSARRSERSKK